VNVALTDRGFVTRQMGVFGKIDVRLVGARSTKLPVSRAPGQSRCTSSSKATRLTGTYRGTIRFRAEGGYTSVSVTRARGVHWIVPLRTCEPDPDEDDPGSGEVPNTIGCCGGGAIPGTDVGFVFNADRLVENAVRSEFRFELGDTPGKVGVTRQIDRITGPPSLINAAFKRTNGCELIDNATFTPPAPFSGSGTLRHEYVGATSRGCLVRWTWRGDLAFRWPGLPPFPLGTGRFPDREIEIPLSNP
jgi:hypothetical protein